ncbi:hypothetical protein GCM10028803_09350 [Larkinella knui]|uniref:Uncharacterized protein n=1 Tax=Larkinella knui TaxID=2025310 RepID=A0A3P1CCQ4_9BACT|nr:DNA-directed RNA polymerase subunit alpha C-terminal domain-containing protein [Larkinella knui]RRB11087.1 hypothetical protein EHT87_28525 [Larkinella knui]
MKEKTAIHPFDQLAKPARRALANAGIKTLEQLTQLSESECMALHGIGKNALQILKTALANRNLSFAQCAKN